MMTDCYDNIHHKRCSTTVLPYSFKILKKAFDSVCHKKLLKKLDFYGIRGVANRPTLKSSYLRNRKQFVLLTMNFLLSKALNLMSLKAQF